MKSELMKTKSPVLISWIAQKNDPYNDRTRLPGPTLTLLFDDDSPYKGRVQNAVLLHTEGDPTDELQAAIHEQSPAIKIEFTSWKAEDPTDHSAIFEFLRTQIPSIREKYRGRELLIHVSPGTPSMQTIWVLMGTTGFIEEPFELVKSYREDERQGRRAVEPVKQPVFETFYKAYQIAQPRQIASEEQDIRWNPNNFRTETMKCLFAEARRFAQIKVPVLLLGERGTGKTTLASWIRSNSPFRKEDIDKEWPTVACGQYTPELLRSELFGYVKGAFTGANKDTEGLLAKAHGDTLFLDEIGDLSADNQRRLIKALEEQTYYPVGETQPKTSDFRLLAATNLDTDTLQERLDPDFIDRISHLVLHLPPLREITDELDWLWRDVYKDAISRAGVAEHLAKLGAEYHNDIVNQLKKHPLPGNMRDLFRIAYRILAARSDAAERLSPRDAVTYGLEALNGFAASSSKADTSRAVARAFADNKPLNAIIQQVRQLPTKAVERDLKQYIAAEIRRIAKDTKQPIEQLCDLTSRTLQNWSKPKE